MQRQLIRSSRGLLIAVSLLLPSIPAAAQDCIFVPDNDPNTGPVSIQPFGGADPNDLPTANQHLLVRIPNALFPRRPVRIREIGFAPAGTGTRTLGRVLVSLGSLPAGTPLSPTFFVNHPGFGAGVMDGVVWDWRVTAGSWNHLGWRTSFPFDPTSNLDLIVEGTRSIGDGPYSDRRDHGLFVGGKLSFPVQRRRATGKLAIAEAKLAKLALEQRFLEERVTNEMLDIRSALENAAEQLTATERNFELAKQLVDAEVRSFELGRSDLLRVQLREAQLADARVLSIDARLAYESALADYDAMLGNNP